MSHTCKEKDSWFRFIEFLQGLVFFTIHSKGWRSISEDLLGWKPSKCQKFHFVILLALIGKTILHSPTCKFRIDNIDGNSYVYISLKFCNNWTCHDALSIKYLHNMEYTIPKRWDCYARIWWCDFSKMERVWKERKFNCIDFFCLWTKNYFKWSSRSLENQIRIVLRRFFEVPNVCHEPLEISILGIRNKWKRKKKSKNTRKNIGSNFLDLFLVITGKKISKWRFFFFHNLKIIGIWVIYTQSNLNLSFCQIPMSLKSYLFILLLIFLSSASSVGLLLFYMNPLSDLKMSFSLMGIWVFLLSSSFLAPIIFFIKKVYYRGDVHIQTMNGSVRQAILITIWGLLMLVLHMFHIYEPRLIITVWATIWCLEVMIQAVE